MATNVDKNLMTAAQREVAVVIVNFRTPALAMRSVKALAGERATLPKMKVIVVDGGSGDGSAEELAGFARRPKFKAWVTVLALPINGGFGWANNQAILRLLAQPDPPEFIHLLNPDTEIEPGAVVTLLEDLICHPRSGATGSQLLEGDGRPSCSAFRFPTLRHELARGAQTGLLERLLSIRPVAMPIEDGRREVDWVTGASVMFRSEALREAGLFDDGFFLYHEELELMRRLAKADWTIAHQPRSRVRHVGGAATGVHDRAEASRSLPRKPAYWYQSRRLYFLRSHGRIIATGAAMAWLAGHGLLKARRLLGLAPNARPAAGEFADHLRHGFPRRADARGGPVPCDSPADIPPAWMSLRDGD